MFFLPAPIKRSSPMARSDSLSSTLSNDDDLKFILDKNKKNNGNDNEDISEDSVNEVHEILIKDDQIRKQWNTGQIPQFPNYHGMDTTRLTARLKAKEKLLEEKTSQLAQLIQSMRKNYRQSDDEPRIDLRPHNNR